MSMFSICIVATALMALALHFALLWSLPRYITWSKIAKAVRRSGGYNRMVYAKVHGAGDDEIVMDNPDVLYSSAAYNLAQGPVRVRCVVPEAGNYWSLALYAWNTDNFFVINDRNAPSRTFDLIIARSGSAWPDQPGQCTAISPGDKGVLLVRSIVNDRNDPAELARMAEYQRQTVIQPMNFSGEAAADKTVTRRSA